MKNNHMTEEQFLENQGKYFFVRLMRYYQLSTTDEERVNQYNSDVLFFEFPEGRYSITYLDLKIKADKETTGLLEIKSLNEKISNVQVVDEAQKISYNLIKVS